MKSYCYSKYLISCLIIVACCLQQYCLAQTSTVLPYKFGFTIDEQQHRREMRDERGIVMGEFGFITADGIYHVTVYATDEQGRFRILAMKNYPYESPPKTVEVMVKPKIAPATTSPKPLTKHNFNTEACSGCFLVNGNNKPKDSSAAGEKKPKHDIMTLSKTLSNAKGGSAASPSFSNSSPSSGKIFVFKPGQLAATSAARTPKKGTAITAAITPTKSVTNSYTDINHSRNNQNNKSVLKTFKTALDTKALQHSNNAQLHNAPHNLKQQHNKAHSNTIKNETNLLPYRTRSGQNIMIFMKPNSFNFLQQNLIPLSNLPAQKNTFEKTQLNNSPGRNLNTDTQPQINSSTPEYSIRPKTSGPLLSTSGTTNKQFDAKITQTAPITTTTKTTGSNKYTKNPAISQDSNQKNSRPATQGGPSSKASSSTATGNLPPIMEIIMEKVLPALMGKTGQTGSSDSSQSTTLNKKSNGPSAQKPSAGNAGFGASGKSSSSGGTGGAAANDDGDLYRFKYILDYHGHTETGKRNGNKEGSYFAIGDDNVERTIEYVANEKGYQPRIRWRKLDSNEIKPKENTLKEYEFVWFQK